MAIVEMARSEASHTIVSLLELWLRCKVRHFDGWRLIDVSRSFYENNWVYRELKDKNAFDGQEWTEGREKRRRGGGRAGLFISHGEEEDGGGVAARWGSSERKG